MRIGMIFALLVLAAGCGKPLVISVAPEDVTTADTDGRSASQHLWLYASDKLNSKMPSAFVTSLARWYSSYQATWARYFRMDVVMLTLVKPKGLDYDLSPDLFGLNEQKKTSEH